jgi:hypothetical protein
MNCGLTNLDTLRKHLLAGSLAAETKFDGVIKVIGLGMAGLFETFTNRRLGYLANDSWVTMGNRSHIYVPRFPIVTLASVQMRYFRTDAWTDISDQPIMMNEETGLVGFGYTIGLQVKVVWTGGFWFETLEPEDDGYPSGIPAGAVALPDALRSAFLLQCELVWALRDKLGTGLIDEPGKQTGIDKLEMSPMVREMLRPYVRYQLS